MDKKPLVTVIMVSYRKFENAKETLQSIFDQDYPNIELVWSDDGSANYNEIYDDIHKFIEDNKRENITNVIEICREQNVGTVKNLNEAIKKSNGVYYKFISPDDDLASETVLSECVEFAQTHNTPIVIGQSYVIGRGEENVPPKKTSAMYRWKARSGRKSTYAPTTRDIERLQKMTPDKLRETLSYKCIISTPSVFMTKELLEKVGYHDETYRLTEDMPFWPKLAKAGVDFGISNIAMQKYRLTGISNGGDLNPVFKKECEDIYKNIYIKNDPGSEKHKAFREKKITYDMMPSDEKAASKNAFFDVRMYNIWLNIKYLLFDTKL